MMTVWKPLSLFGLVILDLLILQLVLLIGILIMSCFKKNSCSAFSSSNQSKNITMRNLCKFIVSLSMSEKRVKKKKEKKNRENDQLMVNQCGSKQVGSKQTEQMCFLGGGLSCCVIGERKCFNNQQQQKKGIMHTLRLTLDKEGMLLVLHLSRNSYVQIFYDINVPKLKNLIMPRFKMTKNLLTILGFR